MLKVFYNADYVLSDYEFDTTRKAKWVADSLAVWAIPGIEVLSPPPVTRAQLAEVHDPSFIRAIETGRPRALAESQGLAWDSGMWQMVLASNGGAIAAALAALEDGVAGSLSSGLHHARRKQGAGFCTFNGLVLAARAALAKGARTVLILDLDAHCGGGTASLIENESRIWQVDVAVSSFDSYESSERVVLDIVTNAADYLPTIASSLQTLEQAGPLFDLCLYNAGMDPFEHCEIGGLPGITRTLLAAREQMVFDWCQRRRIPVAFVLAGGYIGNKLDEEGLVTLHRLTITVAAKTNMQRAKL